MRRTTLLYILTIFLASCSSALPSVTTTTPLPPVRIPTITSSPIPVSGTPIVVTFENGLTWSECIVPNGEYYFTKEDVAVLTNCFDFPTPDENDKKKSGERIGNGFSDLRLVIGDDVYLARNESKNGCSTKGCDFKFLKNEEVIMELSAPFWTFDPNRDLWNFNGKAVWELIADPPVIIMDGINLNETYQWDGSFKPYEIKGKLIYIARKNGKYHVVYDGNIIGLAFDTVQIAYCCATISVMSGNGKYWFLGSREGTQFVVLIQ